MADLKQIRRLIRKAKTAYQKAQAAEQELHIALLELRDLDKTPSEAENAETVLEAVSCYLTYDEYNEKALMAEIKAVAEKQAKEEEASC